MSARACGCDPECRERIGGADKPRPYYCREFPDCEFGAEMKAIRDAYLDTPIGDLAPGVDPGDDSDDDPPST